MGRVQPHYAAPLGCNCLGCRTFGVVVKKGVSKKDTPLPVLPSIQINEHVDPRHAELLDQQVVRMFATSYLLPLLTMTRSANWEIRRGSITSLCRLTDDHLRAAVAALRNLNGQTVVADALHYALSEQCTMDQRREAALGFCNVCGHPYGQMQLLAEELLAPVKRLLVLSHTNLSMSLVQPQVVQAVMALCQNAAVAPTLVEGGFVKEVLRVAADTTRGDGLMALNMRRTACAALNAMCRTAEGKLELAAQGGIDLAEGLLQSGYAELRRAGAALASNMCLHAANKRAVAASPLLPRLHAAAASRSAEDADAALALGCLCAGCGECGECGDGDDGGDGELQGRVATRATADALFRAMSKGSADAVKHAVWAASTLAATRPLVAALLSPPFVRSVGALASGAPVTVDRAVRRDAMRCCCWLAMEAPPRLPRGGAERALLLSTAVQSGLSSDAALQELALVVLGTWAEDVTLHAELIHAGALEPLALAVRRDWAAASGAPPPKAHLHGARALACLAAHETYRKRIIASGALPPLVALLASPHQGVRLSTCRLFCNLSRDLGGAHAVLRAGGLVALQPIARGAPLPVTPSAPTTPVKGLRGRGSMLQVVRGGGGGVHDGVAGGVRGRGGASPPRDAHAVQWDAATASASESAGWYASNAIVPREVLVREYAAKAVEHCQRAWVHEAESFVEEEAKLSSLDETYTQCQHQRRHVGTAADETAQPTGPAPAAPPPKDHRWRASLSNASGGGALPPPLTRLSRSGLLHGSTKFRVNHPHLVVLSAAFVGWRYLAVFGRQQHEEEEHTLLRGSGDGGGSGVSPARATGGRRSSSDDEAALLAEEEAEKAAAAMRIQAALRGKEARARARKAQKEQRAYTAHRSILRNLVKSEER